MSILRTTEISLSELINESNLIVKVKFLSLFKESIPIVDKSKDQTRNPIPPFIKKGCVFQVLSVLKNTARIEVPEKIQVPNENWRRLQSQYKETHAGGQAKTFNVPAYTTEVSSLQKASIVFLHHFQGMYDLTAKDAFEHLAAKEKIEMLLDVM